MRKSLWTVLLVEIGLRSISTVAAEAVCPKPGELRKLTNDVGKISHSTPDTFNRFTAAAFVAEVAKQNKAKPVEPTLASREDGKLKPVDTSRMFKQHFINRVVVHHSALPSENGPAEIQELHMGPLNQYDDIGYHFLIAPNGKIFRGRDLGFIGSHAGAGNNTGSIGIVMIGNFQRFSPKNNPAGFTSSDHEAPSPAAIRSLVQLTSALARPESPLAQEIKKKGVSLSLTEVLGHQNCKATECPGEATMPSVIQLQKLLKEGSL